VSATADEYRSAAPETEGPREPRTLAGPVAASAGTPACDCLAGTALHNDDVCAWRLRGRDCVPSQGVSIEMLPCSLVPAAPCCAALVAAAVILASMALSFWFDRRRSA